MKKPETIFWVKILKFYDAVPQSGMVKAVKSASRFWIKRRNSLMSRKFTGTYVMYMILLPEAHAYKLKYCIVQMPCMTFSVRAFRQLIERFASELAGRGMKRGISHFLHTDSLHSNLIYV